MDNDYCDPHHLDINQQQKKTMTEKNSHPDDAQFAFARGPQTSLFGPLDDSIDFRVNGEAKIEWMRHARLKGYGSLGEYIRMTVEKDIRGEAHLVSMFAQMLGGNGSNVGQAQGGDSK